MSSPVAIAGCGVVSALGTGIAGLELAITANASGLRHNERMAHRGYQSAVGGWVPESVLETLRSTSPAYADARAFLLSLDALRQACLEALPFFESINPTRRGLVLSTTKADIEALERKLNHTAGSPLAERHWHPALLAADLAAEWSIAGPVQCVSAACISGLLAIQQGATLIQREQADVVAVVGVDLISHFVLAGFSTLKSLEPDGCHPFDAGRMGLSLGEGAGALLLVREDLLASPAPRILGWGVSNDANHLTGPSRDGAGLALAMTRALARAAIAPDAIDYLNAHGTGTPYNDAMESLAMRTVFGENVPPFSSSKGMLGHCLGAAGIIETIVCLIALRTRLLPGTPRLRERDPAAPASLLSQPQHGTRVRYALKINCGFGGTNAALVLEQPQNLTAKALA
ncbi:MAG: beta-ketoacyl-[acyl-carrier-protein] synthase family protein [Verrucomicrobiota bacterium]